jgi:hypothetical protein
MRTTLTIGDAVETCTAGLDLTHLLATAVWHAKSSFNKP